MRKPQENYAIRWTGEEMHTGETDGASKYMAEDLWELAPIHGHSVHSRTFKVESRATNRK